MSGPELIRRLIARLDGPGPVSRNCAVVSPASRLGGDGDTPAALLAAEFAAIGRPGDSLIAEPFGAGSARITVTRTPDRDEYSPVAPGSVTLAGTPRSSQSRGPRQPEGPAAMPLHRQIPVLGFTCDEDIAELITLMNTCGIETFLSCQDNNGGRGTVPRIWVAIAAEDFPLLLELIDRPGEAADIESLSSRIAPRIRPPRRAVLPRRPPVALRGERQQVPRDAVLAEDQRPVPPHRPARSGSPADRQAAPAAAAGGLVSKATRVYLGNELAEVAYSQAQHEGLGLSAWVNRVVKEKLAQMGEQARQEPAAGERVPPPRPDP